LKATIGSFLDRARRAPDAIKLQLMMSPEPHAMARGGTGTRQRATRCIVESKQRREVPMRKLAIGLMAAAGVALAVPAAAQTVVYRTAPVVMAPGYGSYQVVPQPPAKVYRYDNGDYAYTKATYPNGCRVTTIRDYGKVTVESNCY
jgi:hypothetical protein